MRIIPRGMAVAMAVVGSIAFAGSAAAIPPPWLEEAALTPDDTTEGQFFGATVAISGDTIAATRYNLWTPSVPPVLYVFVRQDYGLWRQQAVITPPAGHSEFYGWPIALSGDYLAVGAPGDDEVATDAGAVYLYKRTGTTWAQVAKLLPSHGSTEQRAGGHFGQALAMSGDRLLVGAPNAYGAGPGTGHAYAFVRTASGWVLEGHLFGTPLNGGDGYGSAVALDGTAAIVGAPQSDLTAQDAGAVFFFELTGTTWAFHGMVKGSDSTWGDNFGAAVAISGDTAVVGAPSTNLSDGSLLGAAYILVHPAGALWKEEARLPHYSSLTGQLEIGSAVAYADDTALVGMPGYEPARHGSIGSFIKTTTGAWGQSGSMVGSHTGSYADYGRRLAVSGHHLVVGSPVEDYTAARSGIVYVYRHGALAGQACTSPDECAREACENNVCCANHACAAPDAGRPDAASPVALDAEVADGASRLDSGREDGSQAIAGDDAGVAGRDGGTEPLPPTSSCGSTGAGSPQGLLALLCVGILWRRRSLRHGSGL